MSGLCRALLSRRDDVPASDRSDARSSPFVFDEGGGGRGVEGAELSSRRVIRPIASLVFVALGGALVVGASACQVIGGFDDPLPAPLDGGGRAETSSESGATSEAGPSPSVMDPYGRAVLADRPVLYLRFDETSGVRAADSSGNDASVVLSGSPQRARPSVIRDGERSVRLGDGAQLVLDAKYDFPSTSAFTYELWGRFDAVTRQIDVFANTRNPPSGLTGSTLWLSTGPATVGFERWLDQAQVRNAYAAPALVASTPVHLVVVNRPDAVSIFVNGQPNAGEPVRPGSPDPASLTVGFAPGDYDEIAIYDHALDDSRVREHYAIGRGD